MCFVHDDVECAVRCEEVSEIVKIVACRCKISCKGKVLIAVGVSVVDTVEKPDEIVCKDCPVFVRVLEMVW